LHIEILRCITHGAFLQQDYAQRSQDGFLKVELFLQFYCLKGTDPPRLLNLASFQSSNVTLIGTRRIIALSFYSLSQYGEKRMVNYLHNREKRRYSKQE